MKIIIKRGEEVVAKINGEKIEYVDAFSPDSFLIQAIISMGVPILNELRTDRWRVQFQDPDFKEQLTEHLVQYGLNVI